MPLCNVEVEMKFDGGYECKWILSPKEMETRQNFAIYKYVIFEDGTTLFCEVQKQHADILGELKFNEIDHGKPISAGRIVVDLWNGKQWNHVEIGSFTLGLRGSWEDDMAILQPVMQRFLLNESLHS
jgi:hypothetical protein